MDNVRDRRAAAGTLGVMELPTTVQLAHHTTVLAPRRDVRVLGVHPASGLVVEDLAAPLAGLLDGLVRPAVTAELVATAAAAAVPATVTAALLDRLVRAGIVVDAESAATAVRARRSGVVAVHGDGPLAAGLVAALRRTGVGSVRSAVPRRPPPDLVLLADGAPGAAVVAELHDRGTAHLPVVLCDGRGLVGPLVLPGRSACLGCVERHRADADPLWPTLSARLVGQAGRGDPACLDATVGFGAAQALAALVGTVAPGPAPAALGATLDLDATAGTVTRWEWSPHPGCACGAPPNGPAGRRGRGATSAEDRGGETIMR